MALFVHVTRSICLHHVLTVFARSEKRETSIWGRMFEDELRDGQKVGVFLTLSYII